MRSSVLSAIAAFGRRVPLPGKGVLRRLAAFHPISNYESHPFRDGRRSAMNRQVAAVVTMAAGLLVLALHSTAAHAFPNLEFNWNAESTEGSFTVAASAPVGTSTSKQTVTLKWDASINQPVEILFTHSLGDGTSTKSAFFFRITLEIKNDAPMTQVNMTIDDLTGGTSDDENTLEELQAGDNHPLRAHIHPGLTPKWDNTKGDMYSCVPASTKFGCVKGAQLANIEHTFAMNVAGVVLPAGTVENKGFEGEILRIHDLQAKGGSFKLTITLVPEPSTGLLFCFGLIALAGSQRRRRAA